MKVVIKYNAEARQLTVQSPAGHNITLRHWSPNGYKHLQENLDKYNQIDIEKLNKEDTEAIKNHQTK